jgi:hypothetical protein
MISAWNRQFNVDGSISSEKTFVDLKQDTLKTSMMEISELRELIEDLELEHWLWANTGGAHNLEEVMEVQMDPSLRTLVCDSM